MAGSADAPSTPAAPEARTSSAGLFGLLLVPYAALVWRFDFVCDDAFISFRYARNLAQGLGLRYNPGVEPPVEGYTNFLWVLWCALFELIGLDVTVGARVTSVAFGVLTLYFVLRFAERRLHLPPVWAAVPALLLATLPPFAVWSTGGLATVPFTFALFACAERLLGDPDHPRGIQAAALGATAALLRADGALFVGLVLGAALLHAARERRPELARAVIATGAIVGAAVALHLAFRWVYYADLLPNTAYAKVGFSTFSLTQGRNYLVSMLLTFPPLLLVPAAAVFAWAARRRIDTLSLEMLVILLGIAAYVTVVAGGDFMAMARLLVPALPFLAILAAAPFAAIASAIRPSWLAWPALLVGLSISPAFDVHAVPESLRYALRFRAPRTMSELEFWAVQRDRSQRWTRIGEALTWFTQPGDALVGEPIGAIGYHSRLFIYDSFGLVTREVARRDVSDAELRRQYRPPGHHKKVPNTFFLPKRPRFLEALIVPARGISSSVPGYRAVYHPLPPEAVRPRERFLYLLQRVDPE